MRCQLRSNHRYPSSLSSRHCLLKRRRPARRERGPMSKYIIFRHFVCYRAKHHDSNDNSTNSNKSRSNMTAHQKYLLYTFPASLALYLFYFTIFTLWEIVYLGGLNTSFSFKSISLHRFLRACNLEFDNSLSQFCLFRMAFVQRGTQSCLMESLGSYYNRNLRTYQPLKWDGKTFCIHRLILCILKRNFIHLLHFFRSGSNPPFFFRIFSSLSSILQFRCDQLFRTLRVI